MRPAVAAAVTLFALCLAGCGERHRAGVSDPAAAVLHAADLPRGYVEGDDTVCGTPDASGGNYRRLEQLFANERPRGCTIELERVWRAPGGPTSVTSAAYVFRSVDGARKGFADENELLDFTAGLTPTGSTGLKLGDQAKLVRGRGLNDPAVAAFWRRGDILAVLAVEPADAREARQLASRQEARLEGRTTPPPPTDTVELELDDPALSLPVYWLGRAFDPPGPLPGLTLGEATELSNGPGDGVKLDYSGEANGRAFAVTLDLWQPAVWERFRHTRLGRLVWDSPCATNTVVRLPHGRAEIYQGYGTPRPLKPPCPSRPPDRVIAQVYFRGVVVAVDMPYCYACAAGSPAGLRNPYESVKGMKAIVRRLRTRRR